MKDENSSQKLTIFKRLSSFTNKSKPKNAKDVHKKMKKLLLSKMHSKNCNSVLREIWVICNENFKQKYKTTNVNCSIVNQQEVSDSVHYKTSTSEAGR